MACERVRYIRRDVAHAQQLHTLLSPYDVTEPQYIGSLHVQSYGAPKTYDGPLIEEDEEEDLDQAYGLGAGYSSKKRMTWIRIRLRGILIEEKDCVLDCGFTKHLCMALYM